MVTRLGARRLKLLNANADAIVVSLADE